MKKRLHSFLVFLVAGCFLTVSCSRPEQAVTTQSNTPTPVATKKSLSPEELQLQRKEIFQAYRDNITYLAQENLKVAESSSPMDYISDIPINAAIQDGAFTIDDSRFLMEAESARPQILLTHLIKGAFVSGDPVFVFESTEKAKGSWTPKEEITLKSDSSTKKETYDSLVSQSSDFMIEQLKLDPKKEYSLSAIRNLTAEYANEAIDTLAAKYP